MRKLSCFLLSTDEISHTQRATFSNCLPLIFLTLIILFLLYLHDEPLAIQSLCPIFKAASIALQKSRLFLLAVRRKKEPVVFFIGDNEEKSSTLISTGGRSDCKEGLELFSAGDSYKGEFHKGKWNGSGVYVFFEKEGRYEGDWVDGNYNGYGIEQWTQGGRYRGQYHRGQPHGFGVYESCNGDYAGEWYNGRCHGRGNINSYDGSYYMGDFEFGKKHGRGFYHFRNGDRYAGEYFHGKSHGFGVYYFANGDCYEGSWHEGRFQGFGIYTYKQGEIKAGEWVYGNLNNSLSPSHPKVHQFVQRGRNAAVTAIRLPRVEQLVNNAVVAANKAATDARFAAIRAVRFAGV